MNHPNENKMPKSKGKTSTQNDAKPKENAGASDVQASNVLALHTSSALSSAMTAAEIPAREVNLEGVLARIAGMQRADSQSFADFCNHSLTEHSVFCNYSQSSAITANVAPPQNAASS